MKFLLPSITTIALLAGQAFAGPSSSAPIYQKNPILPPVDPSCPCFFPGLNVGGFASGLLPSGGEDALGGGISFTYFFTERIGLDLSYAVHATDPEKHVTALDAIYRIPLGDSCLAPYLQAGGAVFSNGSNNGAWRAGGGVEYRLKNCSAIFADAQYNWVNNEPDATTVRLGMRIAF